MSTDIDKKRLTDMISKTEILAAMEKYTRHFDTTSDYLRDLYALVDRAADPTSRNEFSGHITCSGLVLTPLGNVILIKHHALHKWLLPGGHVEATDLSLRDTACREVEEEIGLPCESLCYILISGDQCPIDIDRHDIPANPKRDEPAHEHWDFRFPFRWNGGHAFRANAEVDGAQEAPLSFISTKLQNRIRGLKIGIEA